MPDATVSTRCKGSGVQIFVVDAGGKEQAIFKCSQRDMYGKYKVRTKCLPFLISGAA
jgi:hypothetical protein